MTRNDKKITVLMSVFNEKTDFLKKSIESILAQTYKNFEFLIINDGSASWETIKVLNEYARQDSRIKLLVNEKNMGLSKSLNRGMGDAQGEYIARIDSDDMAHSTRLEKQLQFMENNIGYALCGSWSYIINEENEIIGQKKFSSDYVKIKRGILYFNFFTHSSLFFKKNLILENDGYDEKIKKAQDYDLILKISGKYPIANIPEFLCFHRVHEKSISAKGKKKQEWYGLIARWRAIFKYGYPATNCLKIIPAIIYFLFVPYFAEKFIFKFLWQKNV